MTTYRRPYSYWHPKPGKAAGSKYVPGHRLSVATEQMLFDILRQAVRAHCRRYAIETLSSTEVEALRKQWTREALRIENDKSWKILSNEDVNLLKPFLLAVINPDRAISPLTARDEGKRRQFIWKIERNAVLIRQLEALEKMSALPAGTDVRHLLPTAQSAEAYIATVCASKHYTTAWRNLLLPILEEQVLVTIEERKRAKVKWAKEQRLVLDDRGTLLVNGNIPIADFFGSLSARQSEPVERAEPDETLLQSPVPVTQDSGLGTPDSAADADDVPFSNQF